MEDNFDGLDSHYDCVIVGTSLIQAILSSALSKVGKKVLHIDKNDYYGGEDHSTFNLNQFIELCQSRSLDFNQNNNNNQNNNHNSNNQNENENDWIKLQDSNFDKTILIDCTPEILQNKKNKKSIEIRRSAEGSPACYGYVMSRLSDEDKKNELTKNIHPTFIGYQKNHNWSFPRLTHKSRYFNFDSYPKLLLSGGKMVDAIVASGVGNYLEFKSIDALYYLNRSTKKNSTEIFELQKLPGSKSDIFNSKIISALEKRSLMKVIQFAVDYGRRQEGLPVETLNENELAHGRALLRPQNKDSGKGLSTDAQIIDQQPEKPFIEFLTESGIPSKLFPFIIYGLSLDASKLCSSNDGLKGIYRHISASGRYGNTSFLVPVYGTSEFAQAFCRLSAVWGGIFVLRENITHILPSKLDFNEENNEQLPLKVNSIKLTNGRTITCDNIICEDVSNWKLPSLISKDSTTLESSKSTNKIPTKRLILRHMILDQSILPEVDSFRGVIVIPSDTETLNNEYAIYVIQLDSSLSVAPSGLFIVYFLTYVNDVTNINDINNVDNINNDSSLTINVANELMSNTINLFKNQYKTLNELFYATFLSASIPIHPIKNKNKIFQNVYETESYTEEHLLYIHQNIIKAREIFDEMYPNLTFLADTTLQQEENESNEKLDAEGEGLKSLLESIETKK